MELKHAVVFGIVFGIVAACIVWYLERFELNRLHGEVRNYLQNQDAFNTFLRERNADA